MNRVIDTTGPRRRRLCLVAVIGVGLAAATAAEAPEKTKLTLRSMRSSVERVPDRPKLRTRIAVNVGYKDANRRLWIPVDVSIHDSAGKEWSPYKYGIDEVTKKGFALILEAENDAKELPAGLPTLSKWVVEMTYSSPLKVGGEEMLTLDVPLPRPDEAVRLPLGPRAASKGLAAAVVYGKEADAPEYNFYAKGDANLWIQFAEGARRWPSVLKLVDENDRKVQAHFNNLGGGESFLMVLDSLGRSKSLKLTLGLDPIKRVRFSN